MHPIRLLFDEINREHWGMQGRRNRDRPERLEMPVRPRRHPLQRLPWLP